MTNLEILDFELKYLELESNKYYDLYLSHYETNPSASNYWQGLRAGTERAIESIKSIKGLIK